MDFELDIDALPLQLNVESNPPVLNLEWQFTLAFGFDENEGFFLYTFPNQDAEMSVIADFELLNLNVDAKLLHFLNLQLRNTDIGRYLQQICLKQFSLPSSHTNYSPCFRAWCWHFH